MLIGVVAGVGVAAGNGEALVELIVPHGVLELSCIVVSGAAGLRIGWAIVDPGRRPRGQALVTERRAPPSSWSSAPPSGWWWPG